MLRYDTSLATKRMLAVELEDMETFTELFSGSVGSAIITDRNDKALEVLARELKTPSTSFAIFYGGGHMPDFEEKLIKDFSLKPVETRWIQAWKLQ